MLAPTVDDRWTFDEAAHRYACDGRTVLSVTQSLELGLGGTMGEDYWTEESRYRGQAIHLAMRYYHEGDLDYRSLPPVTLPYFNGFLRFHVDEAPEVLRSEERVVDDQFWYAGTLDLLCRFRGLHKAQACGLDVLDLVDFKSGSAAPWWAPLQLAGYRRRVRAWYPKAAIRSWVVVLRADSTYQLVRVGDGLQARQDEADYLAVLRVAQIREGRGHAR